MLSHLWIDYLEILHGWFFWPYSTSKFSTALHEESLIFRGHMKLPKNHLTFLYFKNNETYNISFPMDELTSANQTTNNYAPGPDDIQKLYLNLCN